MLGVALLLRVWAAQGDLWFDELWTRELALELDSVWRAFQPGEYEHHVLNTVFLYLLGDRESLFWYRSLSVLTGTGAVALVFLLGRRRGLLCGVLAAWLMAVSLPMVQYASEARGYAPAIFFSLLACLLLVHYRRDGGALALAGFWLASISSALSQLTGLYVYAALLLASVVGAVGEPPARGSRLSQLAFPHVVPVVCLTLFYVAVVAPSGSMGGTVFPLGQVLQESVALLVGAPPAGVVSGLGVLVACGLALWGVLLVPRDAPAERAFHVGVLVLAPAFALLLFAREEVYVRYFVVCFPFFYLLVASVLDDLSRRGPAAQAVALGLLLLISGGQVHALRGLLSDGRGHYGDALQRMAAETRGDRIVVGSDHDFRTEPTLRFYARYLEGGKSLDYVPHDDWPARGVDWVVVHADSRDWQPWSPEPELMARGGPYRLVETYRFAGLSGFHWAIYRNASGARR